MSRIALQFVAFSISALAGAPSFADDTHIETIVDPGADPRHPTASVTHVELGEAEAEGADAATALQSVVGVHTRRTSFGQTAYATVRGSNARQVLVEYEGLRLNPPFGAGFDLGGSSALGFDSVSVWRGAAATYRGGGAVAGALEFRTRHRRKPGALVRALGLAGSQGTYAGSVHGAVASRAASTRVAVSGRTSDGDFPFTDAQGTSSRRVNNDHERRGVFAATEVRDGKAWFRATVLADEGERGTPGLSEFQNRFAAARLDDQQTAAILGIGGRDLARAGEWSFDGSLRGGVQVRTLRYTNPEPFLDGVPIDNATGSNMLGAAGDVDAWGPRSLARIAADVRRDDWRSDVVAERTTAGIGASWEQMLGADWLAVGALRGEVDSDGRSAVLPALGVQWKPTGPTTIRANVGRTFRAPNLDELYLDTESLRGNPDLNEERAWVSDLGVAWSKKSVRLGATAFARIVESEILFLPVTAYLVEAQNIDGTYAVGGEAEIELRLHPVNMRANYTFTRSRFRETSTRVPLQPEHGAYLRFDFKPGRLLGSWSALTLRGPMALDSFDNSNTNAYVFWDAGLAVDLDLLRVGLSVRNVLDTDTAIDAAQQPMPGRTYWASVALRWEDK